ncbi:Ig-like domain-containing protein [Pseudomonas yamanorum]|uniref:Ig-like domain-containing protein n=1 Tax=Pseudomonas yamanorum TaxID=515393 RepID=UPI00384A506B
MNTNAVNVAVVDGKTITESVALSTTSQGQPVRIKAVQNGKYILAEDGDKPVAPENITIKRVGNDLHVATEGTDPSQPQLIIEGFFESQGQLVGVGEDGTYYQYISSDGDQDRSAAFLHDGATSPQVLGSEELVGFGNGLVAGSGVGWFWPALLGLGALGLLGAGYAIGRDNDNKHHDPEAIVVRPDKPGIDGATDNVGDIQGPIEHGSSTDDRTPTFTGTGTPGNIIIIKDNGEVIGEVEVDDEGKWEFTPEDPLDEGEHSIIVVEKDPNGNESDPSDEFDLIVDITAPGKSAIESIFDDFGEKQGIVESPGHTDDNTPTLSGTAEAGSTLEIFANGEKIGETEVDADGNWTFTPAEPLDDGDYEFTTEAVDEAGNRGLPSDPYIINIDTSIPGKPGAGTGAVETAYDDVGPVTGEIPNPGITDDTTPTLVGEGLKPGDTVTIYDDGVAIGEAIVKDDGTWEFEPDPELENGPHPITVTVTNPAGNTSEPSDPYLITVDTSIPGKPGTGTGAVETAYDDVGPITGEIPNPGFTDDTTPTLVGVGLKPGDTVTIYDDGVAIGEAIVKDDGTWEFEPDPVLEDGPHPITVTVTNPAGNTSEPSDPYLITVDTSIPGKPGTGTGAVETAYDDVGPITGEIPNPGFTDDTTPTLVGVGLKPGDTVTIYDDGVAIGEAIVKDDGTWEFEPDPALENGPHPITVTVTNPVGNTSEPSDPYLITVDTVPPPAPTIDLVWDDQGVPEQIFPGDTTDDAQPDISGEAEIGSTVIIYDNGIEIGREVVGEDGRWTHTPVPPLLNGPHDLTAKAQDAAGNISDPSNGVDFNLITGGAPAAPAITGVEDDVADGVGNIMPGGHTNDTEPQVSGTADPFSIVTLFVNGVAVGTIPADEDGNWTITPAPPLTEGVNNLTASASNAAGATSPPTGNYPITVDTTPPGAAEGTLEDNVGVIEPIFDGTTTDDNTPTFSGTAEANTTIIIYDNGIEIGRAPVDGDGNWTFTPAPALTEGPHSFSTQVMDKAGNRSPESTPIGFIVDTSAVVISIEQATDNVGPIQEPPLSSGSITDDTTPTLSGRATATAGSTVNIYLDGVLLQEGVPVDGLGRWEYTVDPPLAAGNYVFTATSVTPAAGESAPTDGFELEIDNVPSPAPTIDEIIDDVGTVQDPLRDGSTTDDTTPTLVGSGVAGDVIIIRNNGIEIGRETVGADGSWSFTPNPPLNNGSNNEFDAIAQDPAGNQSAPSDPWTIHIDTDAPTASAVVESMGKDSGADSGDFVTNDGSAGRLIQGSLTAALEAGEKVQVSTDGGVTWLDAVVNPDGTWNFLDQNSHTGDWIIQTRVVDTAGNANTTSQQVILDNTVNGPSALTWDGATILVSLVAGEVEVGDKVHVIIDGVIVEQVINQADIDSGTLSLDWPSSVHGNPNSIQVAVVDQAGNVSTYQEVSKAATVDFSENFEGQAAQKFTTGQVFNLANLTLTIENYIPGGNYTAGFGDSNQGGVSLPPTSMALELAGSPGTRYLLESNSPDPLSYMSFTIADLEVHEQIVSIFYDDSGNEVARQLVTGAGGAISQVTLDLPYGVTFTSVALEIQGSNAYVWIDDIQFGSNSYISDGGPVAPGTNQDITQGDAQYYGGDADNVFSLADVSLLNGANAGINGGAGVDTLLLTGTGQVLDLNLVAGNLESLEIIDITGSGNNTLNISLGDVLELGESSLFTTDEKVQMIIKGNAGDVVNLDDLLADGTDPGDWAGQGTVVVEGVTYNVYQHSSLDAQLLVQDGVTTNLV